MVCYPFTRNAKRFLVLWLLVMYSFGKLSAQDPVFSQFYNAYLQLNPAMAGNSRGPCISDELMESMARIG